MKIKRFIAFSLVLCCILSGCGSKNSNDEQNSESNSLMATPAFPSKTLLTGRWEGVGYFDSMSSRGVECKYILDFFQDGSMNISSNNMYFYGVNISNMSVHDGLVEFSLSYLNPLIDEELIPIQYRDTLRISMSLQISKEELTGTAKQGDWGSNITFKKTSHEPRSYEETDKLSTQQMAEDVNLLCEILETKHPDAYYTQSKEDYDKVKGNLMSKLPMLDKEGFYYELQKFVASLHDGHTSVTATETMLNNTMILPMKIDYFSGKWYIVGVDKQYEAILGKQITAINDIPIEEVFNKVSEYNSYENSAFARVLFPDSVVNADLLEHIGIIEDGQAIVTINGNERVVVSAIKKSAIDKSYATKIGIEPETVYHSDVNYMYQLINDDILYIQYNACVEMDDYPISQFKEEIANALATESYKKIVVDLRYNSGGNSILMDSFIEPVLKANDNGTKLYCLIGGQTYSSAFTNAITLDKEGAMLVGQPTGGNMQQFAEILAFELPNSRFRGQYSTKYLNYDENAPYDSLYPDKQIDHTIEAYINGIDEEIEYIKKQ